MLFILFGVETFSKTSHAWVDGLTSRMITRPCIHHSWKVSGGSSSSCMTKVLSTVASRFASVIVYLCDSIQKHLVRANFSYFNVGFGFLPGKPVSAIEEV